MPYIASKDRKALDAGERKAETAGELNYLISRLAGEYLERRPRVSYGAINEVIGALECAKLELYRRLASPYEDLKIAENGDAYPEPVLRGAGAM